MPMISDGEIDRIKRETDLAEAEKRVNPYCLTFLNELNWGGSGGESATHGLAKSLHTSQSGAGRNL